MNIPNKLLDKWQALRSESDTQKIAEAADVSGQSVRNAFKDGKCSDELFEAMAEYYREKESLIKQYL